MADTISQRSTRESWEQNMESANREAFENATFFRGRIEGLWQWLTRNIDWKPTALFGIYPGRLYLISLLLTRSIDWKPRCVIRHISITALFSLLCKLDYWPFDLWHSPSRSGFSKHDMMTWGSFDSSKILKRLRSWFLIAEILPCMICLKMTKYHHLEQSSRRARKIRQLGFASLDLNDSQNIKSKEQKVNWVSNIQSKTFALRETQKFRTIKTVRYSPGYEKDSLRDDGIRLG